MLASLQSFAQNILSRPNRANELLTWLIKRDHLALLNEKADLSTLLGTGRDILNIHALYNDTTNTVSEKKCLKNFMTDEEVEMFHLRLSKMKQIKWENSGYTLPVKYYKNMSFSNNPKGTGTRETFFGLSLPIFLNKEQTRVLIGECFTADIAFGRGDVLLCEFKNGKWEIIARVVTWDS